MKLEHTGTEVISSSSHTAHQFNINKGAMAFKVLSNNLYQQKILAIIRELACNAWDSHVAAGKASVPFDLHLPAHHEPWFSIKDYGVGLSDPDIYDLICTYFGSSKTASNKFIGALGLGSKSPFCYTPMFNIKSTFEGVTRIYEARVDEHGEPTVQQMGDDAPTPQLCNGIEIKFSVKQSDIWEFENKAKIALEFFNPVPNLNIDLDIRKQTYTLRNEKWGVRSDASAMWLVSSGVRAIMGNVQYSVGQIDISRLTPDTRKVSEMPLDIFFDIGDLSFTASRETLELDEKTVKKLTDTYTEIYDNFIVTIRERIKTCANAWDARLLLYEFSSANSGFNGLVNDAWNEGRLFGDYANFSLKNKILVLNDLHWPSVDLTLFVRSTKYRHSSLQTPAKAKKQAVFMPQRGVTNEKFYDHEIVVNPNVHFIINDMERGGEKYIHHFVQLAQKDKTHVYVFAPFLDAPIKVKAPTALMMNEALAMLIVLGNPKFDLTSELKAKYSATVEPQRVRAQQPVLGRRNIVTLKTNLNNLNSNSWRQAWELSETQPDGVKYYVTLDRLRAVNTGFSSAIELSFFLRNAKEVFGLGDTPLYGLRKNSKLRHHPDWVEFTGYMWKSVADLMTPEKELQLSLQLCPFRGAGAYDDLLRYMAKEKPLSTDSPFQRFADELALAKSLTGAEALRYILEEALQRGRYVRGQAVIDFNEKWTNMIQQYPLLHMTALFNYLRLENWRSAVLEYVRLKDFHRKLEEEAQLAMIATAGGSVEDET